MRRANASVTDTHPFVWNSTGNILRLGSNAKEIFDQAESGLVSIIIPSIVLAERIFLAERGRITVKLEELFERLNDSVNYTIYSLDLAIVRSTIELRKVSEVHDRIIAATAKYLGLELITNDVAIVQSGYVRTVW
jgi:predicted nucleic acid-binding protein